MGGREEPRTSYLLWVTVGWVCPLPPTPDIWDVKHKPSGSLHLLFKSIRVAVSCQEPK